MSVRMFVHVVNVIILFVMVGSALGIQHNQAWLLASPVPVSVTAHADDSVLLGIRVKDLQQNNQLVLLHISDNTTSVYPCFDSGSLLTYPDMSINCTVVRATPEWIRSHGGEYGIQPHACAGDISPVLVFILCIIEALFMG